MAARNPARKKCLEAIDRLAHSAMSDKEENDALKICGD
jgi:hypothetical protein